MRIYFVVKDPSVRNINSFVLSLGKALQEHGCEVVYGLDRLWTDAVLECDVVHFQRPEDVFGHEATDAELSSLEHRLQWLRQHGKTIFSTCYNLKPPAGNNDVNASRLYDLLYSHADCIVHFGMYSRSLLLPQYPQARHVVVPHHIYDHLLSFSVSQKEARQKLQLPEDKKIVLYFGQNQNDEEQEFVSTLSKHFDSAVRFFSPGVSPEALNTLDPAKLRCCFCAADVVLIQQPDILNSDILPMAFAAGRAVVGPDAGNVGETLHEMGNWTFSPNDIATAVQAVQAALSKGAAIGKTNKANAEEHWSASIVASQLLLFIKTGNYS
ncbi:MAG: hypothetical protein IJ144_07645 [Prevotella sp.]|nr:hypothetical protein [Prevotella sp.]